MSNSQAASVPNGGRGPGVSSSERSCLLNAASYAFTNARNSFAIRTSEGWWMYIMWPASK